MFEENKSQEFCISIKGERALFTDPLTKISGEKCTYPVPTYSALVGIIENTYWKPTFQIIVDKVRIMNRIEVEPYGARPIHYNDKKNDLSIYTYLRNVWYKVEFHYEWNKQRPDLDFDRSRKKHNEIMERTIKLGGRMNPFLGTSECFAEIEPAIFEEDEGYYDNSGLILHGVMLHGITYPKPAKVSKIGNGAIRLWQCTMTDGVIKFPRPEECKIIKPIKLHNYQIPEGGVSNELDSRPLFTI